MGCGELMLSVGLNLANSESLLNHLSVARSVAVQVRLTTPGQSEPSSEAGSEVSVAEGTAAVGTTSGVGLVMHMAFMQGATISHAAT